METRAQEELSLEESLIQGRKNSGQVSNQEGAADTAQLSKPKERPLKMSYKEQREYEQIEDVIAEIESQLERVEQDMMEAGDNYGKLNDLVKVKDESEKKLEEAMERWTYLSELAEEIARNKT